MRFTRDDRKARKAGEGRTSRKTKRSADGSITCHSWVSRAADSPSIRCWHSSWKRGTLDELRGGHRSGCSDQTRAGCLSVCVWLPAAGREGPLTSCRVSRLFGDSRIMALSRIRYVGVCVCGSDESEVVAVVVVFADEWRESAAEEEAAATSVQGTGVVARQPKKDDANRPTPHCPRACFHLKLTQRDRLRCTSQKRASACSVPSWPAIHHRRYRCARARRR